MANTYIHIPYSRSGEHNDGFWSDALKRHLNSVSEKGIPVGSRQKLLKDLEEDGLSNGLDYFLRTRYARDVDVKQAVVEVLNQLVSTGDFELKEVKSPNKGRKSSIGFS